MDCVTHMIPGSAEHLKSLGERVRRERIPIAGALDVTYRCNLRCVHCLVGHLVSQPRTEAGELDAEQIGGLLSEAADAGCLQLLISGGEPLLRPDFLDIYVGARRLGLIVNVFTNATLLTPTHVDVFREYPPDMVEISLYGVTPATYERVTGIPGSFDKAVRGIDLLQNGGVRIGLKTMVLQENQHEVDSIEDFAHRRGLRFRPDSLVTPRLDGDKRPLEQRVQAGRAIELDFRDGSRLDALVDYERRQTAALGDQMTAGRRALRCGAGMTSFHVDPSGVLRPCLLTRSIAFPAHKTGFARAWEHAVTTMDRASATVLEPCASCADIFLCGYCTSLGTLEAGPGSGRVEYACTLGKTRRAFIRERG